MIELLFIGIFLTFVSIITGLIVRNRILFKLGVRNILKRKGYTVIVLFGLMVGTGIISSSLIIGDTMDNMIETEVLKSLYTTDEIIVGRKSTGEIDYFNESIFYDITNQIDKKLIDGLTPQIQENIAILNVNSNLSEPSITLYGIDFTHNEGFGRFISKNGKIISTLSNNQIMIGENTANDLDIKINDKIIIYAQKTPITFLVTYILHDKERAGSGEGIYVNLQKAQQVIGKIGMINRILISNKGGVNEGMEYTEDIEKTFSSIDITSDLDFEIIQTKKDFLDTAKTDIIQITNMFIIFGTFSIIAGIILIINIFVMLAEERKSEMGMSRAIGMQRKHLSLMYISEGTIYALLASLLGVFFGIGIGYLIIFTMEEIFRSFGAFNILQYFTFTNSSLIIGFVTGFLITILTIYWTSKRISKLNIVRAIRNISEPPISRTDIRMLKTSGVILIFGSILLFVGIVTEHISPYISGISLLIFGFGMLGRRWIGDKKAFSLIGIFLLILWMIPQDYFPEYSGDIELFILSGVFLVFASLIIVMFNSESIIKGLTFLLGRGKSRQAVIKTAISYALKSKFRTGMTIAIFALVIYTITTMSMIVGMLGTNIENQVQTASGGYEIIAYSNPLSTIENIEQELHDQGLDDNIESVSAPLSGQVKLNVKPFSEEVIYYTIIGVDNSFIEENDFNFVKLQDDYSNAKEAWNAIKSDPDLIIIDGSVLETGEYGPQFALFFVDLGDTIYLRDKDENIVEKEIIGILDTTYIQGVFSYESFVEDEFGIIASNIFLFNIKEGEDADEMAKLIESAFLKNGMQTIAIKTLVLNVISTMNQIFNLFNAFMALGLIIGIAGLGIITIRSVHERRQEIGMMRAIGFKQKMVLSTFVIETSMITFIGIIIGSILGIFTGYSLWRDEFQHQYFEFLINWQPILFVAIVAFMFTLLCILPASRKAAKISPAEALRYEG